MKRTDAPPGQEAMPQRSWLERFASIGLLPSDSEDERIQKATLTVAAVVITALATVWVTTYFVLGLKISALIPLLYQAASATSLLYYAATKRYRIFRLSQLLLMLLLPFLLHVSLGGFVASSGVILWSFTAPLGALLFYGTRRACHGSSAFWGS